MFFGILVVNIELFLIHIKDLRIECVACCTNCTFFWIHKLHLTRKTAEREPDMPELQEGQCFEILAPFFLADLYWDKPKPYPSHHPPHHPTNVTSFPLLMHDLLEVFMRMSVCLPRGTKHHGNMLLLSLLHLSG